MDAEDEDTAQADAAPSDAPSGDDGVLLELSAEDPGEVSNDLIPDSGQVTLQISGPAVDLESGGKVNEGSEFPPADPAFGLLYLASPLSRHDPLRCPLAERLVHTLFWPPLHGGRWNKVRQHDDVTPSEVVDAAERVLMLTMFRWGQDEGRAHYQDRVKTVRNRLNDRIAEDRLGGDWGKLVGKHKGETAESLNEPAGPDSDDARRTRLELLEDDDAGSRFNVFDQRRQLRRLIDHAGLTSGEREAVIHTEYLGRTSEEAAEEMNSTPGSVRVLKSRAIEKLRVVAEAV